MINTKERVRELANKRRITIAELERTLKIANGTIGKWDKQNPSIEPLTKIADYFGVSTDYLLGREQKEDDDDPNLSLLAAHIDDDATEEDIQEIMNFIDYIKNRKK